MSGEDLTLPENNPLIPGEDLVDPMLTPEGNYLIPEWAYPRMPSRPARASAEVIDGILAAFKDDELEVSAGMIKLERRASGNVHLIKDGVDVPIDEANPEDIERVRTALKL